VATSRQVEVDGRELKLTNLDKVLYPKAGFTKGEVVDYYAKVAPAIIPHLTGRAVTLRRFPEGVDDLDAAFFEKRCPKHRPKWVKTARVEAGPHAG
jgi:bifunctional non-homologous end joining protein LigD